jgi:hypothetical protein
MKKLFLVALLSTASLQAADLSEAWKKINSYRIVSGIKAALFLGAASATAYHAVTVHADKMIDGFKNVEPVTVINDGALTLGLLYASFYFTVDHFWPNLKHAFAIKD